jgi:pyruvate dehydrogenase E2 component (dihydrolipoamide acetyltransferase)
MATVLRMPEVLANVTEAILAKWIVDEGGSFVVGDVLAEVETEKALVDLLAEQDGVLGRMLVAPGANVAVGTPIAVVTNAGEGSAAIDAALAETGAVVASVAVASSEAASVAPASPPPSIDLETSIAKEIFESDPVRHFASPISRRLARDGGIDLLSISGTGPGGRVVRRDVERALDSRPAAGPAAGTVGTNGATRRSSSERPSRSQPASYTSIPHTAMRRAIARRLSESKATIPHFYVAADCVVDELLALREKINAASSVRVSVNDMIVKAAALAYVEVPETNVTWSEDELRLWDRVDIGIAVATEGGLVTPVVRGVEQLTLVEVASTSARLVEQARTRTLRQDDLEGGSFSVTNLGMYGTKEFSAILNPPQSGILAVGAATPSPIVVDGQLSVGTVLRVTLSVDHRAVDGALAARWLAAFTTKIENPVSLLL